MAPQGPSGCNNNKYKSSAASVAAVPNQKPHTHTLTHPLGLGYIILVLAAQGALFGSVTLSPLPLSLGFSIVILCGTVLISTRYTTTRKHTQRKQQTGHKKERKRNGNWNRLSQNNFVISRAALLPPQPKTPPAHLGAKLTSANPQFANSPHRALPFISFCFSVRLNSGYRFFLFCSLPLFRCFFS